MKATITNLGSVTVPLTSTQGGGLAQILEPGVAFTLDDPDITVAIVGDNPSFTEDVKEALGEVFDLAIRLITFWRSHPKPKGEDGHPVVNISVAAGDDNAIRLTGDDKNLDVAVPAGSTRVTVMKDYVELRQLGLANDPQAGPEAP